MGETDVLLAILGRTWPPRVLGQGTNLADN